MLLLTQLTPGEICWGKLTARMIRLGFLLLVFLPATCTSALLGGLSLEAVVGTYAVLAVCAFSFGAFGLNVSFSFRRTSVASVVAVSWSVFFWPLLLLGINCFTT